MLIGVTRYRYNWGGGMHIYKVNISDKEVGFCHTQKMDSLRRKCESCNNFENDVPSNRRRRVTGDENVKHSTSFLWQD